MGTALVRERIANPTPAPPRDPSCPMLRGAANRAASQPGSRNPTPPPISPSLFPGLNHTVTGFQEGTASRPPTPIILNLPPPLPTPSPARLNPPSSPTERTSLTMPRLFDLMVWMLAPATFNGKKCGEVLAYLARAWSFLDNLPMGFTPGLKFMTLLNLLVKDAAVWAIPFTQDLGPARHHTFDNFEHNFKVHFCPVDNAAVAFEELKSWGHGVSHPQMANLQEWTAKFKHWRRTLRCSMKISGCTTVMHCCMTYAVSWQSRWATSPLSQRCRWSRYTWHNPLPRLTQHNPSPGGQKAKESRHRTQTLLHLVTPNLPPRLHPDRRHAHAACV